MDVVPNHMCIASDANHWWNDVLENGRSSPYAPFFDIDWHPPKAELDEKILLPVLGRQYGRVLEGSEISIVYSGGAFQARYGASSFPIGPRTILPLLEPIVADLRRTHPDDHPDVLEMESIVTATKNLPTRWEIDPEKIRERQREKEIVKRRLDALVSGSAAVRDALERSLARHQRRAGQAAQLRRARGAARRAGLSPLLLGRRGRGDQLPAVLRHQRPGRHPHRGTEGAGDGAREGLPAVAGREGHRAADRSRRRPPRPAPLPGGPAAPARRRARQRRAAREPRPLRRGGEDPDRRRGAPSRMAHPRDDRL